ncbi:MAG: SusC/RagA family TonB-linked outer membrane protein [Gemmatimonadetes bacterium]|nr:SusC/RagA family TonB-linked outer membrane protein [Gemmatimonadota bacterium]
MTRLRNSLGVLLAALGVVPLAAQSPTGSILGHVTEAGTDRPVQGVSVMVRNRSAVTRPDGSYLITGVAAGTDTIRARMIGFTPLSQEFTLAAGQTLVVDLAITAKAVDLSEIVVVGYGEQTAGNITGAVTSVTPDEFNTGRIVSPTELIQSKAAGVQVVENNEPGGGTTIRIRGATSVNASNEPLFVIDGLPVGGSGAGGGLSGGRDPLNFLNASDIESIVVLRDASAAAIYGSNAANGVIIITTKKGQAGAGPRFEYSGSVSASSATKYPSMLSASQFRSAVTQYAPANATQLLNANTDWFGEIDRAAYGQEHTFAVSGAGQNSSYRLSGNFLEQNGILQGTTTQRVSLGVNYNQQLFNDRVTLRANLRGSRARDDFTPGGVLGNATVYGPTQPVFDSTTPTGYYDWSGGLNSADNPVAILKLASDKSTTLRSIGNLQGEWRTPFLEGLSANLTLGYDITRATRTTFTPTSLHREQVGSGDPGDFYREEPAQTNTVLEGFLNYAIPRDVGPGLLDLTAGYSYTEARGEFPSVLAQGLSTDQLGPNGIPSAITVSSQFNVQESKLISFFGRVNYNIRDRYLFNASLRRDGSSRFGTGNQWGTFPSIAAAWRLSEESVLKGRWNLSDLKLRASWAKTGNQSFGNYLQYSTYSIGDAEAQYQFADSFFTQIRPSAVDPDIKWEATKSFNLGLDFGFSNQRYTGTIDVYRKSTDDLIFNVTAAAGTAPGDNITTNIGSMRNTGVELSLSAKVLQGGTTGQGLRWTADLTAAHNTNELIAINPFGGNAVAQQIPVGFIGGLGQTIQILRPGVPINSFYVYEHKLRNGKPIYTDENGDNVINEQDLYVDRNGDGTVNFNDRRPFHDPAPKWIIGHSSYLNYGKWDLGFTLRAYLGNYVYNNVASANGFYDQLAQASPYNLHTSVLETNFVTNQKYSDYYVERASFLRMDNITVGYAFNLRGQAARAFATMQNAFTITGYSGVDPTAGLNGIDNNLYPRSRTVSAGMGIQF